MYVPLQTAYCTGGMTYICTSVDSLLYGSLTYICTFVNILICRQFDMHVHVCE